jgi:tripartite-type tricarboxylate transporter receptor subunit TctC
MRAILAAEGDLLLEDAGEIAQHAKEGPLRPLAIMATSRAPEFPDVPTMAELGYDVVAGSSVVLYAPAGMAEDRVARLRTALNEIKKDPALIQSFELTAQDINTFVIDDFEGTWRADWANATELLKAALSK